MYPPPVCETKRINNQGSTTQGKTNTSTFSVDIRHQSRQRPSCNILLAPAAQTCLRSPRGGPARPSVEPYVHFPTKLATIDHSPSPYNFPSSGLHVKIFSNDTILHQNWAEKYHKHDRTLSISRHPFGSQFCRYIRPKNTKTPRAAESNHTWYSEGSRMR